MFNVAALWRHPIKSHGREKLDEVTLSAGKTMPWDRHWAVTHAASKFDSDAPAWAHCRNFMIGASTPALAGIWAHFDDATGRMTLRHTDLGEICFDPETAEGITTFIDWVSPICPADRPQPTGLVKAPARGMTDTSEPTIAIMTAASHHAVEQALGHPIEIERWRGNIWLDGPGAWEELSWIDKTVQIGDATLEVIAPIGRCKHTMANPVTGERDVDTLAALRAGWDHQNFGVYAIVKQGGRIAINDKAKVL